MARSKGRSAAVVRTPRMALPRPGAAPVHADAALVVRFVRFMDDLFGAGNWETFDGEDDDRKALRNGLFLAFRAGAGVD